MLHQFSQPYQTGGTPMTYKAVRKPDSSVSKEYKRTSPKRHWLEFAEYASLAASAFGTLAVAVSGQAFYGVAPITLALSLNVANRYRSEQQAQVSQSTEIAQVRRSVEKMEKTAVSVIVKLRQQLSGEIEGLRHQLATMPRPEGFDPIEIQEQLLSLGQSVASLQEIVASALVEVRQQVSEQLQAFSMPESSDLQLFQDSLAQLQAATKRLQESALTREDWEVVNSRFLLVQEEIAHLHHDLQALADYRGPDWQQMQAQIDQLQQQQRDLVNPHLKRLTLAVRELQQQDVNRMDAQSRRPGR